MNMIMTVFGSHHHGNGHHGSHGGGHDSWGKHGSKHKDKHHKDKYGRKSHGHGSHSKHGKSSLFSSSSHSHSRHFGSSFGSHDDDYDHHDPICNWVTMGRESEEVLEKDISDKVANEWKAAYIECSAKDPEAVTNVFKSLMQE